MYQHAAIWLLLQHTRVTFDRSVDCLLSKLLPPDAPDLSPALCMLCEATQSEMSRDVTIYWWRR